MKKKLVLVLCLFLGVYFAWSEDENAAKKEKAKEELLPMITESVTVAAKVPKGLPYAATAELKAENIEIFKPKDLTDILPQAPGTYVSTGAKSEWGVKLRGLGTSRITGVSNAVAQTSPVRSGCPSAARSPTSSDG